MGRYKGLPASQRLCRVCDHGSVKDEYHFVFNCSLYEQERKSWFKQMDYTPTGELVFDFQAVFQKPYLLGKYLKTTMAKRQSTLKSIKNK